MPSASRSVRSLVAASALLASGCGIFSGDPTYAPAKGDQVANVTAEPRVDLPPPPPLKPPALPQSVRELIGRSSPLDRLRPGDIVRIEVRNEPELSSPRARVTREGTLRLPFMGELRVAGMTRNELQATLEQRLRRSYLKAPEVSVELLGDECRKVYVLGRVPHPGVFSLPVDQRMTLVRLITLAGGLMTSKNDLEADPSAIRLIRAVDGQERTFRVSLDQILEQQQLDQDVTIEPEDVVYVPPKREILIFGSVTRPGSFPLAEGSRLTMDEVLNLSGGFSSTAERNRITVIRHDADGHAQSYHVDMTDEKQRATTLLTANDTIIVADRRVRRVSVVGNVGQPGSYELDESGMTVVDVLARAHWINRLADGDSVRLLRTTPEGRKVYRVPVNSILRKGNTQDLPVLIPGDIIVVPEGVF